MGVFDLVVPLCSEVGLKLFVGEDARLGKTIHASVDLDHEQS